MNARVFKLFLIGTFMGAVIAYGIFSFIFWDFNMRNWPGVLVRFWVLATCAFACTSWTNAKNVYDQDRYKALLKQIVKDNKKAALDAIENYKFNTSLRCPNDDGHFPCTNCKASKPEDENAECRRKEKR